MQRCSHDLNFTGPECSCLCSECSNGKHFPKKGQNDGVLISGDTHSKPVFTASMSPNRCLVFHSGDGRTLTLDFSGEEMTCFGDFPYDAAAKMFLDNLNLEYRDTVKKLNNRISALEKELENWKITFSIDKQDG